jgi:cellulose synthase/poly-beta-1,6-N-acetylglucosamine synthase-like glycosyltransferase
MTTMKRVSYKPKQALIYLIITVSIGFLSWYIQFVFSFYELASMSWIQKAIFLFKLPIEIASSLYCIAFFLVGVTFLFIRQKPTKKRKLINYPPVGIIYLCYNDMDEEALRSIMSVSYEGKVFLIIHDDSTDVAVNAETDKIANHLGTLNDNITIQVLRRKHKTGGKAGAMNYVLEKTSHLYDYFVLCDNDSTILQPDIIERSLPLFANDRLAVVQFRSLGVIRKDYCGANFILRKSIDAFHANMSVYSRFGWQPFIGHNAILRTSAVREVGGFTPGFFSDDLDLTVRLNLKGYKVKYGHDLHMGETHPPNYTAFRKRAYKWSYGCMQSLMAHSGNIITSKLSLAEKCFFFLFTTHYVMSIFLFLYMIVNFIIAPFFMEVNPFNSIESVLAGGALILIIFFPFLSYFIKLRQVRYAIKPVALGALVYGTTDFDSMRGTIDCLLGKKRRWIPTNLAGKAKTKKKLWLEPLFGLILLIVPLITKMSLLFLPSTYLFAGKFLFVPAIQFAYNDKQKTHSRMIKKRSKVVGMALCFLVFFFLPEGVAYSQENHVEIRASEIYKDGSLFKIKGINYGPWMPGTGPNKNYGYPPPAEIENDLKLIKQANANTILVYDPPAYVLDAAEKNKLQVFCTFSINWYGFNDDSAFNAQKTAVISRVNALKQSKALLGWVIGNEIPENALLKYGNRFYEQAIHSIYNAIKRVDSVHPVTHSNWPLARSLNLSFLDIISFNVYPVWPTEVVSRGYGNYIHDILKPIAGSKPLLITEFGINSLESGDEGQARTIKACWQEIKKQNTCGGIVFSFADEWWKNYDNPVRPDNYWVRKPASNDETTHDEDPEEYYGVMTSDRKPKKAYYAVQDMYAENTVFLGHIISIPGALVLALIVIAGYFTYTGAMPATDEMQA